jgi:hypothetical protein
LWIGLQAARYLNGGHLGDMVILANRAHSFLCAVQGRPCDWFTHKGNINTVRSAKGAHPWVNQ